MSKILGKEQIKENATGKFYENIKKSWTYERLTTEEKNRFEKVIFSTQIQNCLKGTYKQRYEILNSIYHSFLMALDYTPIGWRENTENIPLF